MRLLLAWLLLASLSGCMQRATLGWVDTDAPTSADAATVDALGPAADTGLGVARFSAVCRAGSDSALESGVIDQLRGLAQREGRWLYPYDETVMPRGVGAPELMWEGRDAEAVRVRIRAQAIDYEACFRPQSPRRVQLDESAWRAIEQASRGRGDPLTLELTMISRGEGFALPSRTLLIASEALRGSLYYMAYGSRLAPNTASGAIFRLELGQRAQAVVAPLGCAGCHALSADGTRMLAYNALGAAYSVSGASVSALPLIAPNAELAALSPDGSVYVAGARGLALGPRAYGPSSSFVATLYETDRRLAVSGTGLPEGAMMPAFSPEGDALVFNDAALGGRALAMTRFDLAGRRASGYRVLLEDAVRYPGWPTFTPGQRAVVFAFGNRSDYSGNGARLLPGSSNGPRSDLYALALEQGSTTPVALHRALGFASASDLAREQGELPFGAEELHQNYNPQVAPVSAGGFHWLFFDTIRHYGGTGLRRQIWCAALDAADPTASHPAFYVRGQELEVSTFRPIFTRAE